MKNFLDETIEALEFNKKTIRDVEFVTDGKHKCSWEDFVKNANFDYDNGYSSVKINMCLKIVGKNWWFERCEYDGSEWWSFKEYSIAEIEFGEVIIRKS